MILILVALEIAPRVFTSYVFVILPSTPSFISAPVNWHNALRCKVILKNGYENDSKHVSFVSLQKT